MKESCAVFEHQQPSKVKKRSPSESEPRDLKSMMSKETAWMSESCKLPEIRFVRKAAKSVRRSIKGECILNTLFIDVGMSRFPTRICVLSDACKRCRSLDVDLFLRAFFASTELTQYDHTIRCLLSCGVVCR
jgi:hypothetical protein